MEPRKVGVCYFAVAAMVVASRSLEQCHDDVLPNRIASWFTVTHTNQLSNDSIIDLGMD